MRSMSVSIFDIERIVREVLAELGIGDALQPATAVETPRAAVPTVEANSAPSPVTAKAEVKKEEKTATTDAGVRDGDLSIASRIVTMAEIAGRLGSTRRVVVSREALVTPAVRDELLRRRIELAFGESTKSEAAAPVRLVMRVVGTDFDPTSLAVGLAREGLKVEHAALNCLIAATNELAGEMSKPDTLGILLTRHTAAGLCLANRLQGVRAVTGVDAPAVASAASAVGANVLVANPSAGTFFQLKQMVSEFGRGGVRPCPEVFHAQLA